MQERKRREEEAAKLAAANKAKADAAAAVSVAMQSVIAFVVGLRTGVIHLSVWIYLSGASVNLVPLLWTGVPTSGDKNLC